MKIATFFQSNIDEQGILENQNKLQTLLLTEETDDDALDYYNLPDFFYESFTS